MRNFPLFTLLFAIALSAGAQQMNLVGQAKFISLNNQFGDVGNSDVWGWTAPDGEDYAIMGTLYGVHFVRVSDMAVIDSVEGPILQDAYYHRDIKTYRNYCYVVAEMTGTNEGLMIIDMSYLPDSVHFVKAYVDTVGNKIRSHNLSIDTANAMAYVNDHFYQGVRIVDISDPENPVEAGFVTAPSTHDEYARNDTLWLAEGSNPAFSVWDVSNPQAPVKLGSVTDVNFGYCHNIWPTDDGTHFITTEETSHKTVKVWDATNLSNITKVGDYLGTCNLAHNVHVKGDSVYISHYTSGVTVVDISNPAMPVEVAYYDTYPLNDTNEFYGCWGAYPFDSKGYVYGSNFEGNLFVLQMIDTTLVGVEAQPENAYIGAPFPNPATDYLKIPVRMDAAGELKVSIVDMLGREMVLLSNERRAKGIHVFEWPTSNVSSGMYQVIYEVGGQRSSRAIRVR